MEDSVPILHAVDTGIEEPIVSWRKELTLGGRDQRRTPALRQVHLQAVDRSVIQHGVQPAQGAPGIAEAGSSSAFCQRATCSRHDLFAVHAATGRAGSFSEASPMARCGGGGAFGSGGLRGSAGR